MNSELIIYLAVVAISCAIPIIIINSKKKRKEKLFIQLLLDLAEKSNSKITQRDLWNNSQIGIDKEACRLFYIKQTNSEEVIKVVDLSEIQKCRVINTSRTVNFKDSVQTVLEKLELAFVNQDKNKSEIILGFYDSAIDSLSLRNEFILTEKWSEIVNSTITTISQKN